MVSFKTAFHKLVIQNISINDTSQNKFNFIRDK